MENEFQFELKKPVKYDVSGEVVEGTFITLFAPSYKQMDKCVPLKQAFFRVAASIQDNSEEEEMVKFSSGDATKKNEQDSKEDELTPEALISMLYQSEEDMIKILLYGIQLFKAPGIALIDGSVGMTQPLIEKMQQEDLENMLGAYMVNFILASALSKAESK